MWHVTRTCQRAKGMPWDNYITCLMVHYNVPDGIYPNRNGIAGNVQIWSANLVCGIDTTQADYLW